MPAGQANPDATAILNDNQPGNEVGTSEPDCHEIQRTLFPFMTRDTCFIQEATMLSHVTTGSLKVKALTALKTCLLLLVAGNTWALDKTIPVGLLSSGDRDNEFWGKMCSFAQAVADDLNIKLVIKYPAQSTYTIRRAGIQLLDELDSGSYFIGTYIGSVTPDLLKHSQQRNIKTVLINGDILDEDRESVGMPRQTYAGWIGHLMPDDVLAGYLVADELLRYYSKMPEKSRPPEIVIAGLSGDRAVQISFDRDSGLKKRLTKSENTRLAELDEANWELEPARVTTARLLQKYPDVNGIWSASDTMAVGAIQAIEEAGKVSGKDIAVAGIDWTDHGLNLVKDGKIVASIGGHFMEAGIALILIHDYHHGIDFEKDPGITVKTPMYVISQDNIDTYVNKLGLNPDWSKIDFRRFSKVHNKQMVKYDFSWQAILDSIE